MVSVLLVLWVPLAEELSYFLAKKKGCRFNRISETNVDYDRDMLSDILIE